LLLEHQNRQHEAAIAHVAHITGIVDSLRQVFSLPPCCGL
jgi:hypothetical protein